MQPLGLHDPADLGAGPVGQSRVVGKEGHTDGVLPRRRQLVADDTAQQTIGDLDQDSRSVTGVGLGPGGPAVLEVRQRPQAGQHEIMARAALDVGHEGHAARVVLESGVVEAPRRRSIGCGRHDALQVGGRIALGRHWPRTQQCTAGSATRHSAGTVTPNTRQPPGGLSR
jgi:hypothetical protein